MDDVGAFEGAAELHVLRGQRHGMAVAGENQFGARAICFARRETVGQHHAGKVVAREAGGLDAAHHDFTESFVGVA